MLKIPFFFGKIFCVQFGACSFIPSSLFDNVNGGRGVLQGSLTELEGSVYFTS
jgi:hypothetical protein